MLYAIPGPAAALRGLKWSARPVIPWVQLDTAPAPEGDVDLRLMRRGEEFSIMIGGVELMNSRLGGSEESLATLACDRIAARPGVRLLIGGLGMGFTLRAALPLLSADARVEVVELVPQVVAWARGPLAALFDGSLDDPRVQMLTGDVLAPIAQAEAGYDAILLDVDNGPDGLVRRENDRLYSVAGLAAARRALRPGGVLAVWSSATSVAFTERLRLAGFSVREQKVPARRSGGKTKHVIWLAEKPAA